MKGVAERSYAKCAVCPAYQQNTATRIICCKVKLFRDRDRRLRHMQMYCSDIESYIDCVTYRAAYPERKEEVKRVDIPRHGTGQSGWIDRLVGVM